MGSPGHRWSCDDPRAIKTFAVNGVFVASRPIVFGYIMVYHAKNERRQRHRSAMESCIQTTTVCFDPLSDPFLLQVTRWPGFGLPPWHVAAEDGLRLNVFRGSGGSVEGFRWFRWGGRSRGTEHPMVCLCWEMFGKSQQILIDWLMDGWMDWLIDWLVES